ncbi:MAG: hypothetical protein GY820_03730, partial [Gammaproteobacteria bacterium]|nr:hypothetical protein [Gammaproteobacteria bacterium]
LYQSIPGPPQHKRVSKVEFMVVRGTKRIWSATSATSSGSVTVKRTAVSSTGPQQSKPPPRTTIRSASAMAGPKGRSY